MLELKGEITSGNTKLELTVTDRFEVMVMNKILQGDNVEKREENIGITTLTMIRHFFPDDVMLIT